MILFFIFLGLLGATPVFSAAPVTALAYSQDGTRLLSGGSSEVVFRSPENGRPSKRIPITWPRTSFIAMHPSEAVAALAVGEPGVRGGVLLLRVNSGQILLETNLFKDQATGVHWNAEGSQLVATSLEGPACLIRVHLSENGSMEVIHRLGGHTGGSTAGVFLSKGSTVVTAGRDRSLKVWSAVDGKLLRTLNQHTDAILALTAAPVRPETSELPSYCVSAGEDRTVRVWQPEINRMVRIIRGWEGPIACLVMAPSGSALYGAGAEGVIRRMDLTHDQTTRVGPAHGDWIYALALSPDGKRLASGDWKGEVNVTEITP